MIGQHLGSCFKRIAWIAHSKVCIQVWNVGKPANRCPSIQWTPFHWSTGIDILLLKYCLLKRCIVKKVCRYAYKFYLPQSSKLEAFNCMDEYSRWLSLSWLNMLDGGWPVSVSGVLWPTICVLFISKCL